MQTVLYKGARLLYYQYELNNIHIIFQANTNISDWCISGRQLCQMTIEEFRKKLPKDPENIFWTHIQLIKKSKKVSVVHKEVETAQLAEAKRLLNTGIFPLNVMPLMQREPKIMRKTFHNLKKESKFRIKFPKTILAFSNSFVVFSCSCLE